MLPQERGEAGGRREWGRGAGEPKGAGARGLGEVGEELSAKQTRQDTNGKEEVVATLDPSGAVGRDAASGDDAMDMGMMKHRLRRRVEDREKADVGAEMLGVGSHLKERLRGGTEEDRIDDLLVPQGEDGDLGRHREDDMEVGDREQLGLPLREPLRALVAETGGAMAIAAGIAGSSLGNSHGLPLTFGRPVRQ